MTNEERKALEATRQKLIKAMDEAVAQANQFKGGIAMIEALLKEGRVELGTFSVPAANGSDVKAAEAAPA